MSPRNRAYNIGIGLCAFVSIMGFVALGCLIYFNRELYVRLQVATAAEHRNAVSNTENSTANGDQQSNGTPDADINILKPNVVAEGDGRISNAEEENLSYRDVVAQEGMFWAAVGMIGVSLIQALVGWIGIIYIRATLKETKRTTRSAIRAVDIAEGARIDAERQARQQLRAYISITPHGLTNWTNPPQYCVGFTFKQHNHGETPGGKIRYDYDVQIFSHPLPAGFSFPPTRHTLVLNNTIFPDSVTEGWLVGSYIPTQSDIAAVHSNASRVHFWGTLFYEDAFGVERSTKFCCSFDGVAYAAFMIRTPNATWNWEYGPHHNEAT